MNDIILIKELSKEGNKSTSLFKIIENGFIKYFVINFVGFKVMSQMQVCEKTYKRLKKEEF